MNMTCEVAMDLAELYHAELVSAESAGAIHEHLKECSKCRSYYKEYDAVRRHHFRVPSLEDIADTEERMYASLSRKLRRRRFAQIVGTSAAIGAGSIMLAAGLIMLSRSDHPSR